MTDIITCPACRGAKRVNGLGMIQCDCSHCKGIGHVSKQIEKEPAIEEGESLAVEPVKKKKGRPFGTPKK